MIFNPAHPGEVLKDYLSSMTVTEAAARLRVTRATLSRILNGRAGVTAEMSLRLSAALGTSPDFWLKMQGQYDLWHARKRTLKVRRFPRAANRQAAQRMKRVR
jgi:addiction module HigA family antidote